MPQPSAAASRGGPERERWLERLPATIRELQDRWALSLAAPFASDEVTCAWVAPAVRSDGTRAVLKLGMPHMEGTHELEGLRFWDGDPTVRLLEADADLSAMLLESCEPGTSLRDEAEPDQDVVIAGLLRRLWRRPPSQPFRPLSTMLAYWTEEAMSAAATWSDAGLVRAGLALFSELSAPSAG